MQSTDTHIFNKLILLLLLVAPALALGQTRNDLVTIAGTVVDFRDNEAVPGVSIMVANKAIGFSGNKGEFRVQVPKGASVSFVSIGYTTFSYLAGSTAESLRIRLQSSSTGLNEVVVTALGIKREQKSLGYATTTLDTAALTNAVSSNWTDALSGKVAGLNLVRNSGPAGSNKVILRGENNLTGDNEALIVIDGVVASAGSARRGSPSGGVYGTSGDKTKIIYNIISTAF